MFYAGHDWMDKALAIRSMEMMANAVMPAVNAAMGEEYVAGPAQQTG